LSTYKINKSEKPNYKIQRLHTDSSNSKLQRVTSVDYIFNAFNNMQEKNLFGNIHEFDPKVPYIFNLDGPILFSAPHSMPLDRIDFTAGRKKCNHLRERFAANIAIKFAHESKKFNNKN